jgi:hypothetical protein
MYLEGQQLDNKKEEEHLEMDKPGKTKKKDKEIDKISKKKNINVNYRTQKFARKWWRFGNHEESQEEKKKLKTNQREYQVNQLGATVFSHSNGQNRPWIRQEGLGPPYTYPGPPYNKFGNHEESQEEKRKLKTNQRENQVNQLDVTVFSHSNGQNRPWIRQEGLGIRQERPGYARRDLGYARRDFAITGKDEKGYVRRDSDTPGGTLGFLGYARRDLGYARRDLNPKS